MSGKLRVPQDGGAWLGVTRRAGRARQPGRHLEEGREQGILVGRGVEPWMGRDVGKDAGWGVRCGIIWAGKDGGRRARCPAALPRRVPRRDQQGSAERGEPGTRGEERGGMLSALGGCRAPGLESRGAELPGREEWDAELPGGKDWDAELPGMLSCQGPGRAGRGAAPRGSLAGGNLIFMKCSCLNPKSSAPVTRSCVTLRSHGNCCYFQDPRLAEWHKSAFPFSCPFFPAAFSPAGRCFRGCFRSPLGRLGAGRRARGDAGAAALSWGGRSRTPAPAPAPAPAREPLHESGTGPAPPK